MKKHTIRVTETYTVEIIADSTEMAKNGAIKAVAERHHKAQKTEARSLGWIPCCDGSINDEEFARRLTEWR